MTPARTVQSAVSNFYLKFDGRDVGTDVVRRLREVSVESSLHLPDVATVVFRDPEVKLIDDDTFKLGAKLSIDVKVHDTQGHLFDGEIVEIEPRFSQHDQFLVIRAFDRLHRLSRGTFSRSFQNVSDMDLVRKIAAEVGLQAKVGPASFVHEYVFQNNQTNLAFLRGRAAALGYVLYVNGTTLHCEPPKPEGEATTLTWGENLVEFVPRLSSLSASAKTQARGWDPKTKRAVLGQAGAAQGAPKVGESRTLENAAESFEMKPEHTRVGRVVRDQGVADAFAQADANRRAERLIEASGVCGGHPGITAGVPVKIEKVGSRFGGVYYVSSATHSYRADRGFTTEFVVSGQSPGGLATSLGAGHQDGAQQVGFAIGLVTNNQDPQHWGRVKVMYPGLTEEHESDWARVVSVGGGNARGVQYLPEVDDEVLVGFELGDIHHPYVLGGLWNGQDAPPKSDQEIVKNGKVNQRLIRSRSGHLIILDDTDGQPFVELRSSTGHVLRLDDKGGGAHILIQDKAGNTVKLDTTANTLSVQVKGDVRIDANGNVDLKALASIKAQAPSIELNGSANVKISGGVVEVTGGLIKLN